MDSIHTPDSDGHHRKTFTHGAAKNLRRGAANSLAQIRAKDSSPHGAANLTRRALNSEADGFDDDQKGTNSIGTPGGFADFYRAYPKHVAKEAAAKAYDKAIGRGIPAERIQARAKAFAIERHGQDPKYTPHPATWLNAGRYDDPLPDGVVLDQTGAVVAIEQPQPDDDEPLHIRVVREMREAGVSW